MDRNSPILIVAQDPVLCQLLAQMAQDHGMTNVHASDDSEMAWTEIQSTPPALVIADWDVQPLGGFGLLRLIRRDPALAATPCFLVVAPADAAGLEDEPGLGPTEILVKPVHGAALGELLDKLIEPST